MEEENVQFCGREMKEIQEQYMSSITDLYDALRLYETENDYLSGMWKGDAATTFFDGQKKFRDQLSAGMQKTERLIMALMQTEKVFEQGEKEISGMLEGT